MVLDQCFRFGLLLAAGSENACQQGVKWFETVTYETMLDTFITKPKGPVCFECGCISESKMSETIESLAASYKTNAETRLWFESCRKVIRGVLARHWVPNTVGRSTIVGMKSTMQMVFVTTATIVRHYKADSIDVTALPSAKWYEASDPEGVRVQGILLKTSELPPGMPHFTVELFSLSEVVLQELFLNANETVDENHGNRVLDFMRTEECRRRGVRVAGSALALTWGQFDTNIRKAQATKQEQDALRLRELELADVGMAPATATHVTTSGSRFRRPEATQVAVSVGVSGKRKVAGGGLGAPAAKAPRMAAACRLMRSLGSASTTAGGSPSSKASVAISSAKSTARGSTGGGGSEGGGVIKMNPGEEVELPGGVANPDLAKLLVSSHGKPLPSISQIINGAAVLREIAGVALRDKTTKVTDGFLHEFCLALRQHIGPELTHQVKPGSPNRFHEQQFG
jgi:hypothetical protein